MVKRFFLLLIAVMLALSGTVYAVDATDTGTLGADQWAVESDGDLVPEATGYNIGSDEHPVGILYVNTLTLSTPNKGQVNLPIASYIASGSAAAFNITASTAPGLEMDNYAPALVWSDGETSPAMTVFTVPNDYYSGGVFKLFCDSSAYVTPVQVDFFVYVNSSGTSWSSVSSNQTPVALTKESGTPEQVQLTVSTDFSALAAGQRVTFGFWRDDVAAGTGDLEVYNTIFEYNRN